MNNTDIITLHGLSKNFNTRVAVSNLSLSIPEKSCFALLGFNGAGKTTTIKMLSGLTKPTSGDAFIAGKSILTHMEEIKPLINISPQETAIAPNLTVLENLVFIAEIYGFEAFAAKEKAMLMMKRFGLIDRQQEKAKKLSGGLKRRLSIAMALITDPKILFLDEPTLGLDIRSRRELWTILKELKTTVTIVLTTHYLEEVEHLADIIAIIDKGSLKTIGTLEQLQKETSFSKLEDIFIHLTEDGGS